MAELDVSVNRWRSFCRESEENPKGELSDQTAHAHTRTRKRSRGRKADAWETLSRSRQADITRALWAMCGPTGGKQTRENTQLV